MYEINGKFGQVRLCRTYMNPPKSDIPFILHGGGWHRCNELYHIQRSVGIESYTIFFSVSDGGRMIFDGQLYEIPASSIAILPPDKPHEYYTAAGYNWEFYWLHTTGCRNILDQLIQTHGYVFTFPKAIKAGKLMETLFPEQTDPDEILFEITASKTISDILHILLEASYDLTFQNRKNGSIVHTVLREMEENYGDDINISKLADENFISQQHMIRLFKAETGYTPYEYLKKHRLKKAMELLAYSDLPIAEIAKRVGFSGANNFIFQFRNEYGVTPSRYRKFFY